MRIFFLGLLSILLCVACSEQHDHKGKTPLVELDGNFLYREDLQSALPARLSKDDSLLFAEHYIRNWVEDVLLYEKAQSNIPDNGEIEKLVENYRKALIMHTYQQALIHQRLSNEISEGELADYYEKNKELFRLERPLMQGLFIKVPLTAPQLNNVRRWYKAATQDAVEHLEKYSLQNAVKYEYFYDKWVPMADVLDLIPLKVPEVEDYVNKNRHIELKDTAFYYFLNVSALLFVACVFTASAQKFALIDMEYILKNIPAYEQANTQLNQASQQYQSEVEAKAKEAEALYKEYQKASASLSAAQKTQREEAIVAKEKEAAELRKKYFGPEGEMAKKQEALIAPIQDKIYEAVKQISEQKGYAAVVDRGSAQSIIFASPSIDISNEVLSRLGYSN